MGVGVRSGCFARHQRPPLHDVDKAIGCARAVMGERWLPREERLTDSIDVSMPRARIGDAQRRHVPRTNGVDSQQIAGRHAGRRSSATQLPEADQGGEHTRAAELLPDAALSELDGRRRRV